MTRIDHLMEMLREDPKDPFLHYALALELEKNNQLVEAVAKLKWLREEQADYLPLYYKLGKLLEGQQKNAEAIHVYQQGIELARVQSETKTLAELKEALFLLEEE